jgi:hypothetical protein
MSFDSTSFQHPCQPQALFCGRAILWEVFSKLCGPPRDGLCCCSAATCNFQCATATAEAVRQQAAVNPLAKFLLVWLLCTPPSTATNACGVPLLQGSRCWLSTYRSACCTSLSRDTECGSSQLGQATATHLTQPHRFHETEHHYRWQAPQPACAHCAVPPLWTWLGCVHPGRSLACHFCRAKHKAQTRPSGCLRPRSSTGVR